VWRKRRWRCRERECPAKTWTERCEHLDAQAVITRRAGMEACRQVGENARPVSQVAEEFGVCWWTVMNAVIEHGTPLVDDPARVGTVTQLGVDETSFLKATAEHATVYATGLVDLVRHRLIDMVEGNSAGDLRKWATNADPDWLAKISVVATDLAESYRAGLSPHLDHARRVTDPFHVVRVGEPLRRQGSTPRTERDEGASWTNRRSAVPDPQVVAHRLRTTQRAGVRPDAARPARR
jgi:transposase